MTETSGGGQYERRPDDDPGYANLGDFKQDLRSAIALGSPSQRLPKIRSIIAAIGGGSTSTISNVLNIKDRSIPSTDTVRKLATAYDKQGLDYWLERRDLIAAQAREAGGSDIATATGSDAASDPHTGPAPRRRALLWATALLASAAVIAAVLTVLAVSGDPKPDASREEATDSATGTPSAEPSSPIHTDDATEDVEVPTDYSDPVASGCVDAGSKRLKTEVVNSIGVVSLVYSAICDAYWARAERTDGQEVGNHIDLSLTARNSSREPAVANDGDAPAIYTYLLTGGDASAFCVDAAFWVDDESFKSPRICVDKQ